MIFNKKFRFFSKSLSPRLSMALLSGGDPHGQTIGQTPTRFVVIR